MTTIINDISQINPVEVSAITQPESVEELQYVLKNNHLPVSVGGGKFSMGGQTSSPQSLHIDLRKLNKVLFLDPIAQTIKVQAGIRWCDIQKFIDPHNLSVKIMQTYANFTVGGALSVNCHGRYMGLGPVVLSVLELKVVLIDGSIKIVTPEENSELYYGLIGGYGALGIIVEVTLSLAKNTKVQRVQKKLKTVDYLEYFKQNIRQNPKAIFHNCDLYPPHYQTCRSVSWVETEEETTQPHRLMKEQDYSLQRYFMWAITETPWGKKRREFLLDPIIYLSKPIHYRNYEAGYDVKELEPKARENSTYVLQEYFIPVNNFLPFTEGMKNILNRFNVNAVNISIRHALADTKTYLNWAKEETFAFVLYYKQKNEDVNKDIVAIWTRELIDLAIINQGTYYLPYQPHATIEQFHQAYPKAQELFSLKEKYDPEYRLQNSLWNKYYLPHINKKENFKKIVQNFFTKKEKNQFLMSTPEVYSKTKNFESFKLHSFNFQEVLHAPIYKDKLFLFLQNIFHLYPEDKLFNLIKNGVEKYKTDEEIYRFAQLHLKKIKPFLSELTYAIPALKKQKAEMKKQTLSLFEKAKKFNSEGLNLPHYLEIGSNGRYASVLQKDLKIKEMKFIHETLPSYSPPDLLDREQIKPLGRSTLLNDYEPVNTYALNISQNNKVDLLTCYIGLHHIPLYKMDKFIASISQTIKEGGYFILRDHDVKEQKMFELVRLAHIVFNMGLNTSWEVAERELHYFRSIEDWINILKKHNLTWLGNSLAQEHDPTDNLLLLFQKV